MVSIKSLIYIPLLLLKDHIKGHTFMTSTKMTDFVTPSSSAKMNNRAMNNSIRKHETNFKRPLTRLEPFYNI